MNNDKKKTYFNKICVTLNNGIANWICYKSTITYFVFLFFQWYHICSIGKKM